MGRTGFIRDQLDIRILVLSGLSSFPATIYLKDCNFLIALISSRLLCNKLVGHRMCGLISGLFIPFD